MTSSNGFGTWNSGEEKTKTSWGKWEESKVYLAILRFRALFGMVSLRDPNSKVVERDLQRSGIKRSRIESTW